MSMKVKFVAVVLLSMCLSISKAQFYKSVLPSPEFTKALEKVVLDFRLNYETIKGNAVDLQNDYATYESLIKLPGSSNCIIQYYNSKLDTTASWQAVMYQGDDYSKAVRAYENTFRLVKKSRLNWVDKTLMRFNGEMETPKEEVKFALSTLDFDLEDVRYKNFKAEVELVQVYDGWQVNLNLLAKKPDYEGDMRY